MTFRVFTMFNPVQTASQEGGAQSKEHAPPISIFGSAVEKKKNHGRGFGTGHLGFSTRLAECRPSVKTPSTKKPSTG